MAEEMRKGKHGKKNDQKMKPYLVYQYLMRHSDASHIVTAKELEGYLENCGISAERRSIYRDIEEINKALLLTTTDKYGIEVVDTIEDAEEMVKDDANKTIVKCRCLLKLFEIFSINKVTRASARALLVL